MKHTLVMIALALAASSATAAVIPIANSGFDAYYAGTTDVIQPGAAGYAYLYGTGHNVDLFPSGKADFPAWSGETTYGAQNLGAAYYATLPNGSTGWASPTYAASYLWQTLGVSFEPNSTYTLSVWVYDRLDTELSSGVFARVDAGTTALTGATVDFTPPADGGKALYTWTYTTGATAPEGQMYVVVGAGSGTGQANFDDVSLTVVPEPLTLALIVVGTGTCLRRRRQLT